MSDPAALPGQPPTHRPASHARLALIRHGQASGNQELRYLGATDAPLTPLGEEQARAVAAALAGAPIRAVYTSPLRRAWTTAEPLVAALGLDPATDPRAEPRLREQSYGQWEGLTFAEASARDHEAHARWEADPSLAPEGGESLESTWARAVACADEIAQRHAGEVVALISHVGPIKALVCAALGLRADATRRMWLHPASICVVDWPTRDGAAGALRLFNGGAEAGALMRALA